MLNLNTPCYNVCFRKVWLVVACVATMLAACGQQNNDQKEHDTRPVETVMVGPATGSVSTIYSGQVVPEYAGNYGFRVAGMIVERFVDVGDTVKAGQILAKLDPKDIDTHVRAAKAQVSAAQAQAETLAADLRRARKLAVEGFISAAELDRVKAGSESADSQLQAARALLTEAQQAYSYTELRSAKAGVVVAVRGDAGEVVPAGLPVVTVADPSELEAAVSVPEGEVARFRSAQLGVRLWTDRSTTYPAKIRTLSAAADPKTRTFDARVSFVAPAGAAAIGNTAEVVVKERVTADLVRVPLSAVVEHQGQSAVWVVSGEPPIAHPRTVTIQTAQNNALLLSSGVQAGELIVSAGAHLLKDGQVVRPVSSSESSSQ